MWSFSDSNNSIIKIKKERNYFNNNFVRSKDLIKNINKKEGITNHSLLKSFKFKYFLTFLLGFILFIQFSFSYLIIPGSSYNTNFYDNNSLNNLQKQPISNYTPTIEEIIQFPELSEMVLDYTYYDSKNELLILTAHETISQNLYVAAYKIRNDNTFSFLWLKDLNLSGYGLGIAVKSKDNLIIGLSSEFSSTSRTWGAQLWAININDGKNKWNIKWDNLSRSTIIPESGKINYLEIKDEIIGVINYRNSSTGNFQAKVWRYTSDGKKIWEITTLSTESARAANIIYYEPQEIYLVGCTIYDNTTTYGAIKEFSADGNYLDQTYWNPDYLGISPNDLLDSLTAGTLGEAIPKYYGSQILSLVYSPTHQSLIILGNINNKSNPESKVNYLTQTSIIQQMLFMEKKTILNFSYAAHLNMEIHQLTPRLLYEQAYESLLVSGQTSNEEWLLLQITTNSLDLVRTLSLNLTDTNVNDVNFLGIIVDRTFGIIAWGTIGQQTTPTSPNPIVAILPYEEYNPFEKSSDPDFIQWSILIPLWLIPFLFLRKDSKSYEKYRKKREMIEKRKEKKQTSRKKLK